MTDHDEAVRIAARVLCVYVDDDEFVGRMVVAALTARYDLAPKGRLEALEAVAEAARGLLLLNAPGRAWDEQMGAALDAAPEPTPRTYHQLTEQEGGPPNERWPDPICAPAPETTKFDPACDWSPTGTHQRGTGRARGECDVQHAPKSSNPRPSPHRGRGNRR